MFCPISGHLRAFSELIECALLVFFVLIIVVIVRIIRIGTAVGTSLTAMKPTTTMTSPNAAPSTTVEEAAIRVTTAEELAVMVPATDLA